MMSRITGRDTMPELTVRSGLHRRGFRFSLHRKDLPGKPDLVLPVHQTIVFVHGCFWHCHHCDYFRLPKSNRTFWRTKLEANVNRDKRNIQALLDEEWYVATIWECSIRDQSEEAINSMLERLADWVVRQKYRRRRITLAG